MARNAENAEYITEDEAMEILTAIQNTLPDVAQKITATRDKKNHFTTLKLS